MNKTVLIPIPNQDFDPTETAVPWKILKQAGINVVFATPNGNPGAADPIMVTGRGLGPLCLSMPADHHGLQAYEELVRDGALSRPKKYSDLLAKDFDGLILPGGHAQGMKEYLESQVLQGFIGQFFLTGNPVGAICHGVVLAARTKAPNSPFSVLRNHKTTALPRWMELLAWNLTRAWMGDYYRTYPMTVQAEVEASLNDPRSFVRGPISFRRDSNDDLKTGFVVRDQNFLSARWPGDAHLFGHTFLKMLREG